MAKRELSSTLKNLKFMQRAAHKEAKSKPEDAALEGERKPKPDPDASFGAPSIPVRRCIVIMEGDPRPGALKGRMSFQSFNPSIEKINEEAANIREAQSHISSNDLQNSRTADRANDSNLAHLDRQYEVDHKRKEPEMDMETPSPPRPPKGGNGDQDGPSSSQSRRKNSYKQQKREKLDWNVLRPPKAQAK